jgi:sulfur carrier protein ThiS
MTAARAAGERQHSEDGDTIGVTVTLFADLRRFLPPGVDGPHRRTVPAGSTIGDLLVTIGIPEKSDVTVGLDGELANRTDPLHDGADVMLLSPMEGG